MEKLTKKSLKTSRGYTYAYYVHKPSTSTPKPALVLCHGWPDNADLYAEILPDLLPLGFPLLIPDCLGYDGTSKPTDPKEYNSKDMATEIYELVDAEGFDQIIPVGHDWGSFLAQRIYLWRPERCEGLVILNVAYLPPGPDVPFDLTEVNNMTEKLVGYPIYAYWELFAVAEDGPKILKDHVETLYHAIYSNEKNAMKKYFCNRGQMRDTLLHTKPEDIPLKPFAQDPDRKAAFIARLSRNGFEGPQCWYKAYVENVQYEVEKAIPKESLTIQKPVLFIGCTEDAVCRTDAIEVGRPLLQDLTVKEIESGHWCTYEKPAEIGEVIASWVKEKYL